MGEQEIGKPGIREPGRVPRLLWTCRAGGCTAPLARLPAGEAGLGSVQTEAALGAELRCEQHLHRNVTIRRGVLGAAEPARATMADTFAAVTIE
jgi:hypothetical protein